MMNAIADSVIVVGDLNIHHASWLRFSSGDTVRGRHLKDICDNFGLKQLISQPTRGEYLLDLCLSNSRSTQVEIKSKIADHACLLVKEPDAVEIRHFEPRQIWKLDNANWPAIEEYVSSFDWSCLGEGTVDEALDVIMSVLDSQMHAHIPRVTKTVQKSNLPWLNDRCRQAVAAKHEAEGNANYNDVVTSTSEILRQERSVYMQQLRTKMEKLVKNSKQWWSLNKRLLDRQASPTLFPPLKNKDGIWCRTPKTKADAFAICWAAKCELPPELFEHFFVKLRRACPVGFLSGPETSRKFLAN